MALKNAKGYLKDIKTKVKNLRNNREELDAKY